MLHVQCVMCMSFESHVRNSHRGVLHADREDRPIYRASQSVRPLGPLRGTHEAQDMRSHTPDTTALMQYKYVHVQLHKNLLFCYFFLKESKTVV